LLITFQQHSRFSGIKKSGEVSQQREVCEEANNTFHPAWQHFTTAILHQLKLFSTLTPLGLKQLTKKTETKLIMLFVLKQKHCDHYLEHCQMQSAWKALGALNHA